MTTPKAKRGRKPKQGFLPDMDPPSIKPIDDAAEIYFDTMQERVRLSKEEAKDNLIDLMKQHDLTIYETSDGKTVSLLNKSNVKVKRKKDSNDDWEDES